MSKQNFAALYHADDIGQVLVIIEGGDEGPEIRFSFKPEGLGVCSVKLGFPDSDDGWEMAEEAFGKVTEETAFGIVRQAIIDSPISRFTSH